MTSPPALSLQLSQRIVAATLEVATEQRAPVAVVVVDAGGRPITGVRADGVGWVNWEVAVRKAVAAATFGAPTHAVREMATEDPVLVAAIDGVEHVLVVPGGFPVQVDGVTVGGLGIAGGHYAQDQQIGEKALAVIAP